MSLGHLTDMSGRRISYLRLSVTDRCDLRCVYCMSARPKFLPKSEVLNVEEIDRLVGACVARGVRKVRLTGGEPLVRRGIIEIVAALAARELDELTLTSNATLMTLYADQLNAHGIRRVNISLDSLRKDVFAQITRGGDIAKTLAGIDAAQQAGLKVKINIVAMAGVNEDHIPEMIGWAHGRDMDVTLIETMPMTETGFDLTRYYLPLSRVRKRLERLWQLTPEDKIAHHGGPARYVRVEDTGGRLGFITPLTHNFCASCNRIRITCTGQLYMCLGHPDHIDLRAPLRASKYDAALHAALDAALAHKAPRHNFYIDDQDIIGSPSRSMSLTGG